MNPRIVFTNDTSFEVDVLKSHIPVLVVFWAHWCGPCKMLDTVLNQLAAEKAHQLKVAKINIDSNREISQKFNISGVPTLMMFNDGVLVGKELGVLSKTQLTTFIEESS